MHLLLFLISSLRVVGYEHIQIGILLIPDPIEVSNESLPTALAGMIESSRGLVIKLSL